MKKINERFKKVDKVGESDIYRKYDKQFDKLFDIREVIKSKEEFENIYVENLEFEKDIKRFKSPIKFCVGYKGIGKTTVIRHCFGLEISDEVKINENELIFPVLLDEDWINSKKEFDLNGRIAAVCTKLEDEYPYLRENISTDCGKEEFYIFMRKYAASALECINPVEAMDMDRSQLIRAKLNGAYVKNPFEFLTSQLKYYISKNYNKYERLVIILDNIEMLPENRQTEIIYDFVRLQRVMQKTEYPLNKEFQVNLLISVQPYMYQKIITSRYLDFSGVSESAIVKKSVDFKRIFKKRFDYYIGNKQHDENYNNLMVVIDKLEKKYEDIILHLCFFDIRKGLVYYSRIFANRFWIQCNKVREEDYIIEPSEYKFDNIRVLRALACNENCVFWGDDHNIIPNILYTTKEEDISVYCFLVLSYFYKKSVDGIYSMELETIKVEWLSIFGDTREKIIDKMTKALEFLFEKKVVQKLIIDFGDLESLETKDLLKDKSKLYLSSRGKELYEMLKRDSVYLEMLRENVWRSYIDRKSYSEYSSNELMEDSKQSLIFKDLLEYINYLREEEEDVLLVVRRRKKEREYKKTFGKTLVVQVLLEGVKKSIEYSGNRAYIQNEFYKVEKSINETRKQINL